MQLVYSSSLAHHGILGMKWGVRRYQNKDGSLTRAGKKHYNISDAEIMKARRRYKANATLTAEQFTKENSYKYYKEHKSEIDARRDRAKQYLNSEEGLRDIKIKDLETESEYSSRIDSAKRKIPGLLVAFAPAVALSAYLLKKG